MKKVKVDLQLDNMPIKKKREVLFVPLLRENRTVVHSKFFFPPGVFRLLTGTVEKGEDVDKAAKRELEEETGLKNVKMKKILLIEHNIKTKQGSIKFYTWVYLVQTEKEYLHVLDKSEGIKKLKIIKIDELPKISEKLRSLKGKWKYWGELRAIAHDVVYQFLKENQAKLINSNHFN